MAGRGRTAHAAGVQHREEAAAKTSKKSQKPYHFILGSISSIGTITAAPSSTLTMPAATSTLSATGANAQSQYAFDHGLLTVIDASSSSSPSAGSSPGAATPSSSVHKSVQALLTSMIASLPISVNPDHGPIATLPLPSTALPRAKPLPKPKPLTKWQEFARKKGIPEKKKKEGKLVWDEDTKEWVPRWGYKGANKKEEEQWIHEVPANKGECAVWLDGVTSNGWCVHDTDSSCSPRPLSDDDYDPSKAMKAERKKRKLANEAQRLRNVARATAAEAKSKADKSGSGSSLVSPALQSKAQRKAQLEASSLRARASTASMGRFDKQLTGEERKPRGQKRAFDPNEVDVADERKRSLAILGSLGKEAGKKSDVVNSRKAVRFESKGEGALALARKREKEQGGKGGKGGKRR